MRTNQRTFWVAKREAANPRTDEDAAMAYQRYTLPGDPSIDRFKSRATARNALMWHLAVEHADGGPLAADALAELIMYPHRDRLGNGAVRWVIKRIELPA